MFFFTLPAAACFRTQQDSSPCCEDSLMSHTSNLIGIGLYAVPEAARVLGVHPLKVRRWLGLAATLEPVITRTCPVDDALTFAELMELMFVSRFRSEGVSLPAIRKAASAAARKFKSAHPFAMKRFDTDGKTIFATLQRKESDQTIVEDLAKGQLVFDQIIKPFFRKIEYGRQDAMRYWPLETTGRVVLDPERRFGQPIDNDTGIPTATLAKAVKADPRHDVGSVARWFDVPKEAVKAAVSFENSLTT